MKRPLLLLAALALVPGCYGSSSCSNPGSLTFYWRFESTTGQQSGTFDADNPATAVDESGCTFLDVPITDDDTRTSTVTPAIRIIVDGAEVDNVGCVGSNGVPGALLPGVFSGVHTWQIDAFHGGRVAFTASGSTPTSTCGNSSVDVVLRPAQTTDLIVRYNVNGQPPPNCKVAGVTIANVPWELRNANNQIIDSTCVGGRDPVTSACTTEGLNACDATNFAFTVPFVPLGNYTMNYVELWDVNTPTTHRPLAEICGAAIVHDGFPVLLNLSAPTNDLCPTSHANPLVASSTAAP